MERAEHILATLSEKASPGTWELNPEYLDWIENGEHSANPVAITAGGEPVITSSEWLTLSRADAVYITALVNWHRAFIRGEKGCT